MSKYSKELYEFSKFRLEVYERRLSRNGKVLRVPDKVFDTLLVLVRRRGELVTKEELMSSVWPDSIVEENNLDQKISALRGILADRSKSKERFIETVRGHGYRFLPEVVIVQPVSSVPFEIIDSSVVSAPPASDLVTARRSDIRTRRDGKVIAVESWQRQEPERSDEGTEAGGVPVSDVENNARNEKGKNGFLQISLVAFLVAGLFFLIWTLMSPASQISDGETFIESIAVMPFANDTGNTDNDFLSEGLTDSLIGSLSQLPGLSVKARNSVFRYKGQEIDARSIGHELSVAGVLIGRLKQRGENLILSLELVDARTGNAVWAEQYDRKASEIVPLQREIAQDVAAKLRSRLSKADQDRVTRVHTTDPEANHFYLQGMYLLNKRTAKDLRNSIEFFNQAIREDPGYAKAYAGVAMACLILPDYSLGMSPDELREYDQKFRAAAQKAYALDDSLPETVLLSAAIKDVDWDVAAADREYKRSIELDPNFATPRHWYSRFLGGLGRFEEALAQINKAYELDPYSRSIAFNVGARLADVRRFDEAIAQYRRVLEMEPDHPLTHFGLASAYDAKGLYKQAIEEHLRAEVLLEKASSSDASARARALSTALEKGGERGYWEKRLELSLQDHQKGLGSNYAIAICLARLRRFDEAFNRLEASLTRREPNLFWIKTESAFDPVSDEAKYKQLLSRIGLPE